MKTDHAKVHFNEQGTPVADAFDDVYFSNDSGVDETRHVFIAANQLPERWQTHQRPHFVIAETGFGTGLNCLVAMQAFAQFRQHNPQHPLKRLYILTTEKYPLARQDMAQALAHFTAMQGPAEALLAQYPLSMNGCHRLDICQYHTCLDIWMGDVHELLPQWQAPHEGLVDAWFLDGFAPSKNPDMWTAPLFEQMARLSRTGATFGTFTAAGVVKRGLQAVGFEVSKQRGFGRKRDMLAGAYAGDKTADAGRFATQLPYSMFNQPALSPTQRVGIVGAGLAGASAALALVERGIAVTLLTRQIADGASGNPQGGFYPQLHAQASHASQLQAHSFLFSRRRYAALFNTQDVEHDWCGVLQLDFTDAMAERHARLADSELWPAELIRHISGEQASDIAGVNLSTGALHIPAGGWLSPPQLVNAMLAQARQSGLLQEITGCTVTGYSVSDDGVTIHSNQADLQVDQLVFAGGADNLHLPVANVLPLRPVRGQVEAVPQTDASGSLSTVLCHKGYLTPAGKDKRHALGSTYVKNDLDVSVREQESKQNLATHQHAMPQADWLHSLQHDGQARAAIRLGMPDHQPACRTITRPGANATRLAGAGQRQAT